MFRYFAALTTTILLLGCSGSPSDPAAAQNATATDDRPTTTKVTLQLNWFPEAEHGGYYAALVHGYYEAQGLEVTVIPGGPGIPVTTQVANGQVTFGVSNAQNVALAWAQEAKTVAVMAPLQHSPRCIMVHAESGIRNFDDLKNVTLSMNASSSFSLFLQKAVPLTNVKIVPYTGNVAQFLLNKDFAQQAYVFSEPFVARSQGAEPVNLMVSDLGFDPYTSVLITHPDVIASQPALVRRMVAASIRGWQTYLNDPQATNEYIHRLNEDMGLDVLEFGAREIKALCIDAETPLNKIGQMTGERWGKLVNQLEDVDALENGRVDPQAIFTTQFLPNETASSREE